MGFTGLPRNQLLNIPTAAAAVIAIVIDGLLLQRAYLARPAFLQPFLSVVTVCFILLLTLTDRIGIYMACIFGSNSLTSVELFVSVQHATEVALDSLTKILIGPVLCEEHSPRTKQLIQGIHGLAHAQARFDIAWNAPWANIYEVWYGLGQLQMEVEHNGSFQDHLIVFGVKCSYLGF